MVLDVARQAFYSSGGYMTRARNGEPERFYQEVVLTWASDDCLLWPYAKAHGYGVMGLPDKTVGLVHRRACEDVNGKPAENEIALHSCNNGHLGCCNYRHLYWGSRRQNMIDALESGRVNGLTPEKQEKAKQLRSQGQSYNSIAGQLGVSPAAIGTFFRKETFHE